ncbi:MAG: phage integrase N-terminal SAM-like domain-containing protein [Spirochaetales bacterium]|nr:phage integrase N-terminal SAM-like domain-containing protein [Spirochaetales bacterium]
MKHYAARTEKSRVYRVRRFILFHQKKHTRKMRAAEVQTFLSRLAQQERVSASTQNQALNALLFLYKQVIRKELGFIDAVRAKRPKRLPVVLTQS